MKFGYSQPYFIPWPGFFYRAASVDKFILMDSVQFPRGFTWINRNRIKGKDGELWLTVPVCRKGKGLQKINEVEIYYGENWIKKHLHSIKHSYKNSPYFEEIFPEIERIYLLKRKYLMDFLLPLIELIRNKFKTSNNFLLLSDLGIDGKKEYLLLNIAEKLGADTIVIHKQALSHLNIEVLAKRGLNLEILKYRHPVYPQLWGEFLKDLSSLDILFNLGHLAWNTVLKWQKSG